MNLLWGLLVAAIGALFVYWASTSSSFAIYRGLEARSRMLWGDRVHRFYQVVGAILIVLGVLWATGVIW